MRFAHATSRRYAMAGALLGAGAPLGLLAMRWWRAGFPPALSFFRDEVAGDPLLYAYIAGAPVAAFVAFGIVLGLLRERVEALSLTDALTRLWNRRHFETQLEIEVHRARRYRTPLTLLILDLDRFKVVNDRFGHPEGDRVLRVIARMIRDSFRSTDIVCRYGGEEIAVITPNTTFVEALGLAERTRERISQTVMPLTGEPFRVTVSVGLATLGGEDDGNELTRKADTALYRAKAEGRNLCRGEEQAAGYRAQSALPLWRRATRPA